MLMILFVVASESPSVPICPTVPPPKTKNPEIQSTLASPFDKVRALESVLAERDASKHEVGMLRELLEKGAGG